MEASGKLLNLDRNLVVRRYGSSRICVDYKNCWVSAGCMLEGTYGEGITFELACEDYLKKISGKTLVFDSGTDHRKEVTVL